MRYAFIRQLGEGGFGEVYQARDSQTGSDVALKVLAAGVPAEAVARFEREARVLALLEHPAVVRLLDWGVLPDGRRFYAMPFIPGAVTLKDWIAAWYAEHAAHPPPEVVMALVAPLASALDTVHALPSAHRDLKPTNVLVLPGGAPLLIDFGLAGFATSQLTRTGQVLGTMNYIAPEQVNSPSDAGPPADIYALGLILYELCTGVRATGSIGDYMKAISLGQRGFPSPSTRNPAVGEALSEVILRATEPDPAHRFPSGAAIVTALAAIDPLRWSAIGPSHATAALAIESGRVKTQAWRMAPDPRETERPPPASVVARRPAGPAPREAPHSNARLPVAVLAVLAAFAAVVVLRRAPPAAVRPGPPELEVGLASVIATFTTDPPAEALLEVETPAGARTLPSERASRHRVRIDHLAPGDVLRVRAVAGGARGPVAETTLPPPARIERASFGAAGVFARVVTRVPARCTVRVRTRAGPRSAGGAEGLEHDVSFPADAFPMSRRWTLELDQGDEHAEVSVPLPAEARIAWATALVGRCEDVIARNTKRIANRASRELDLRGRGTFDRMVAELPPGWLAEELGGHSGVLDDPLAPPELKDRLSRVIGALERMDAELELLSLPALYPHQRLYGEAVGPHRGAPLAGVETPVALDAVPMHRPFAMHPPAAKAGMISELPPAATRSSVAEVHGRFVMPRIAKEAQVELRGRLTLPVGRALRVELNGHEVRLGRDRRDPAGVPYDFAVGVDPRMLIEGTNSVTMTVPPLIRVIETAFVPGEVLVWPGLSVRFGR